MALPNYVKFQRGTPQAYERLAVKDQDTLYFIYDTSDASKGTLYLGSRLIGSVGGSEGVSTLEALTDTLITSASTGDFLVLNSEGKWINLPAADVAQSIISSGSQFVSIDENQFQFNAVNGQLELKGFADATAGLMPVKSATGISWQTPAPDLSTEVGNLQSALQQAQTDISNLQAVDVDAKIATAIAQSNHLTYEVINDLADADEANVVYLYPSSTTGSNNIYDEYMLINNSLERIGQFGADLSNYVTNADFQSALNDKADASDLSDLQAVVSNLSDALEAIDLSDYVLTTTFNTVVGDLSTLNTYNGLQEGETASVAESLEDIYERLTWRELTEN